ncbi:hypothetical protein AHMF7605_18980 [Adhaeribacter arboris]|uniref:Secretion system C-terminal sorting domain-containing protein n=1 Tax=Adhaeribacter arboris TaxID=2072846 RepID=A0A2T2YIW6_9BACT|nr:T9SS type A sorting domain-containing protein [Adhaeribacter arboris]PSR55439.1 hypothetical protein AHMF7605_18980 [Adhaeribacter arboris]
MAMALRKLFGCLLLLFVFIQSANATHILSGEIIYQADTTDTANPLHYFYKLIIYQDGNSVADMPFSTLYFGDGTFATSARTSKVLVNNSCDLVFRSTYYFENTFTGPGSFTTIYREVNRYYNQNMDNSIDQAYVITAQINIDLFDEINRSPRFILPIMPCAIQHQPYHHSLATTDPDHDSLVYELITPLTSTNSNENFSVKNVTGYTLPQQVSLNAGNGEFIWDKPTLLGRYSFAVRVNEYRNKYLVGTVMRDFVINVVPGPDNFTHSFTVENRSELSITDENQIFLTAGQPIKIKVKYHTTGQSKQLFIFSELFFGSETIPFDTIATEDGILAEITLNPEESWRRSQPYILVLRGISEVNGTLVQQDFTLTLLAKPELVSGGIGEGPGEADPGKEGGFVVYPNPAQEFVWVKSKRELPRLHYRLYNALQQVILQTKLNLGTTRIPLPPVATGIYFYQISAENGKVLQSGKLYVR